MARPTNPRVSVATHSTAASDSAAAVVIVAANANRTGLIIHNNSTATLYLKYGTGAASTSLTRQIATQTTWEMPTGNTIYTGAITGRWAATNGDAQVTEY
jgi:hypothetical protein